MISLGVLLAIFILLIITCIIQGIIIIRNIFSIRTFLKFQQVQTQVLIEIAKLQGVDSDKIESIIDEAS